MYYQQMRQRAAALAVTVNWAALAFLWALEAGWLRPERVGVRAGLDGVMAGPGLVAVAAVGAYALVAGPLVCAFIAWKLRGERGGAKGVLFWAAALYCLAAAVSLATVMRSGGSPSM